MNHAWFKCQNLPGETYAHDVPGHCQFCDGGLSLCTVCGGFEGSLTKDCPGHKVEETDGQLVYKSTLDFVGDRWIRRELNPWEKPQTPGQVGLVDEAVRRLNQARTA